MDLGRFTSLNPVRDLPQLTSILERPRLKDAFGKAKQGGWYRVENISATEAEIFIYDHIGDFGVTANDFISELREIKASKIALHINSPGGDVFDGIAIYNALKRHAAKITVWVDGIAASSASFIAMAGDEIVMASHSQMMIHEASGLVIGQASDMLKMAEILNKSSDNIASIYAERTGATVAEWRGLMQKETWFSDIEAVEAGLADRVDGEDQEAVAARMTARQTESPEPIPIDALSALKEGTSKVVKKEPLPAFDFKEALKVGTARG